MKSNKPIATHFQDEAGNKYQTAYIDGYWFGDRQLESVIFKCTLDPEGFLTIEPAAPDSRYWKTLNADHWLKEGLKFAEGHDIFCADKSLNGEEIWFAEPQSPTAKPEPVAVKGLSFQDVRRIRGL